MEKEFGIKPLNKNGLACFKVTICQDSQQVDVVCSWSAELLFNQVVNALNIGNKVIIDVYCLPIADEGER